MKKLVMIASLTLSIVSLARAVDKVAIIDIENIFHKTAQKTGIARMLINEFKERASELKYIENNLQTKIQRLQNYGPTMSTSERTKLEKDVMLQRQLFVQKAESFEQDRQRRSDEERSKLLTYIYNIVRSIATDQNIDLVINASAVTFSNKNIKDITSDTLKQVVK